MKIVLLRVGLTFQTSVGSRRGFLTKFPLSSPRFAKIGFLTQGPKREKVLIHQVRNQLGESVVKSIEVNVLWDRIISLVVAKVDIK